MKLLVIVFYYTLSIAVNSVQSQGCYEFGGPPPTGYQQSPVFCTSETEFIIPSENNVPDAADIIECPEGLICADHPEICVDPQYVKPACPTVTRPCRSCANRSKYACINEFEFVLCLKQTPSSFKQKCPTTHPYCGYSAAIVHTTTVWPCVSNPKLLSCSAVDLLAGRGSFPTSLSPIVKSITPPTTYNPLAACNSQTGAFPVTTDVTCKLYFYCYMDGVILRRIDYACPDGYVFKEITKKCTLSHLYTCPYLPK